MGQIYRDWQGHGRKQRSKMMQTWRNRAAPFYGVLLHSISDAIPVGNAAPQLPVRRASRCRLVGSTDVEAMQRRGDGMCRCDRCVTTSLTV